MHGTTMVSRTGEAIEGAELDVWHTAPIGYTDNETRSSSTSTFEEARQQIQTVATIPIDYGLLHTESLNGLARKLLHLLD